MSAATEKEDMIQIMKEDENGIWTVDQTKKIPSVSSGSYNITHNTVVDGGRNAAGDFEGCIVCDKLSISLLWERLTAGEWSQILKFIEQNFVCRLRFWNDVENGFDEKNFYWGDRQATPQFFGSSINASSLYWINCSVQLMEV